MSGIKSSAPGNAAATLDAEPLSFTVHSMPRPALDDGAQRRTRAGRTRMLLVLFVCALPVLASYFTYFVVRPQARSNYATLIEPTRPLPLDLPLTDLDRHTVDPRSLLGQWLLVVVGDAGCDAGCERRLFLTRQLREMTGRERDRIDKLWLVTDDAPVRPDLRAALEAAPPTRVLRVPRAALQRWLEPEGGQPLQAHVYLVDPMGQWMMRVPAEPDPDKLKRDVDKLLRASASWDRAGR